MANLTPRRLAKIALLTLGGGALAASSAFAAHNAILGTEGQRTAFVTANGTRITTPANVDRLLISAPDEIRNPGLATWSRDMLRESPLNARALRIYAYVANQRGESAVERRAMELAARVSRRDVLSQLWLIESDVGRNDLQGALVHYDIALRTAPEVRSLLFEQLSSALSDPGVNKAVATLIRTRPLWLPDFVNAAINTKDNPRHLEHAIAAGGGLPNTPAFAPLRPLLLQKLVATGEFGAARRFYLAMPGAKPATLAQPGFNRDTIEGDYAPFTWGIGEDPLITVGLEPYGEENGAAARVAASFGGHGRALRRLLFLTPGTYKFSERREVAQASPDAAFRWSLSCGTATTPLQTWDASTVLLKVPAGCGAQLIELTVSAGSDQGGAEAVISDLSIRPVAAPKP